MTTISNLRKQFDDFKDMSLKLDMERGQPADENFDLSLPLLAAIGPEDYITDSGVDIRNFPGGIAGLREAREIFCEQIRVSPSEILIGNNSSLELMSHFLSWALLNGVKDSESGWVMQRPKLIVTVPGYDRHFSLAEALGYELVTVDMSETGPDMAAVEALVADDASIKGIYFVPTYSNPTGDSLSLETAERLVTVKAAAPDFTLFADDAYAVHHLVDKPEPAPNLLDIAKQFELADRVIIFGSSSKVTLASAGICFVGMSEANIAHWSRVLSVQSIGPNKAEQWRHVRFLRQYPGGIAGLMRDHAAILNPKFDIVQKVLDERLGNRDLARWSHPEGGYFVSVQTNLPVADRVIALASELGVTLTPAGATYPKGIDPDNSNIRLSPTRPPQEEVRQAMEVFVCCVELATAEYIQEIEG